MTEFLIRHRFGQFKWFRMLVGGGWIRFHPGGRWFRILSIAADFAVKHPEHGVEAEVYPH